MDSELKFILVFVTVVLLIIFGSFIIVGMDIEDDCPQHSAQTMENSR